MTNRYNSRCARCSGTVLPGQGDLYYTHGHWEVVHYLDLLCVGRADPPSPCWSYTLPRWGPEVEVLGQDLIWSSRLHRDPGTTLILNGEHCI